VRDVVREQRAVIHAADAGALHPASFSMDFSPTTLLIPVVRRFVLMLYERIFGAGELSSELALMTHELLENAVKYSKSDEVAFEVSVVNCADGYEITARTSNTAEPENIARVREMIASLQRTDDVFEFYQALLHETVKRPDGSGLGLARIECETCMSLEFANEGDRIWIIARCVYRPGGEI
jgi:hypothetical protein